MLAYDILVGRNLKWKRDRALKGLDNLALSDKILNDQIDRKDSSGTIGLLLEIGFNFKPLISIINRLRNNV